MAKFCIHCGKELNEGADICLGCGRIINGKGRDNTNPHAKSKVTAGILAIFAGSLGIHNFYLGYTNKAVTQLLLTIFGYILMFVVVGFFMIFAVGIWCLVEAIMIFTGKIDTDAKGNPLVS